MIPETLRLTGFLSYLEPVSLNFADFDLACISGSNGAGKSSLLDAITWALFGQARRRDDSIINSRATSAEVVFDFTYENDYYRVQRSKTRDKTTVLEFFLRTPDGGWKALTEKSVRETEAAIQRTLRLDFETFTNASFFLQGKADQFAQQKPGDRKRILSSILGLEIWELYRERAANRRKQLEEETARTDAMLEDIAQELAQEPERKETLKRVEAELSALKETRAGAEAQLDDLRRRAAALEQQRGLVALLAERLQASRQQQNERQARLEERAAEQARYQAQVSQAAEIEAAYQQWQAARLELERWEGIAANFRQYDGQRSSLLAAIETERARLEQERQMLAVQREKITQKTAGMRQTQEQLAAARQALADLGARVEQRPLLEEEERRLVAEQADLLGANKQLKPSMDELKERIDRLNETSGAVCPLCGQPLNPEDRQRLIDSLITEGKSQGDRYRANATAASEHETRRKQVQAELSQLRLAEDSLRAQQRRVDQMEQSLTAVDEEEKNWQANDAPRLIELERQLERADFAAAARAGLEEINARLKDLGYDAAAHDATRRAELDGRSSEEQRRALDSARATLGPLEREIGELRQQIEAGKSQIETDQTAWQQADSSYQASAASLPNLDQAERELLAMREKEAVKQREAGSALQYVEALKKLHSRKKNLGEQRAGLVHQTARLKLIEKACGKDGVPALLIDQALPEIEAQANDILDRLSDGNMVVRFATQKDFKDKHREDKKETLDILIGDAAGWREYELFSGGEAFRVNFAIRLALSRVLSKRAGARLQTLVIDEGFGSQDAEGRQRLVEAINLVRPDFAKILVITHLEELKDHFQARIEVDKGPQGSSIRVLV